MTEKPKTPITPIIDALGGREAAAAALGISENAIYKWENGPNPGVPPKNWPRIKELTEGKWTPNKILAANEALVASLNATA